MFRLPIKEAQSSGVSTRQGTWKLSHDQKIDCQLKLLLGASCKLYNLYCLLSNPICKILKSYLNNDRQKHVEKSWIGSQITVWNQWIEMYCEWSIAKNDKILQFSHSKVLRIFRYLHYKVKWFIIYSPQLEIRISKEIKSYCKKYNFKDTTLDKNCI
jgi:hypothetical protein